MSSGMRALHLYTGLGYSGVITTKELNKVRSLARNIQDFVVHLGDMSIDSLKFDGRKKEPHQLKVIDQMISDLEDFLYEWKESELSLKNLYISLPALDNSESTLDAMDTWYPYYRTYMRKAKTACGHILGDSKWERKVKGFYFPTESIYPIQKKIDESRPTSNEMVKLLNDISYQIHSLYEKEFMWCPYYGFGENAENVIFNLGVVANRTNIFDIICIQPQYYFQGINYKRNVDRVYDCAMTQEVVDKYGKPIAGGRKSSATALIGVNMEGNDYFDTNLRDRWNYYIDTFKDIVEEAPIIFYVGATKNLVNSKPNLLEAIDDFFEENY